MANRLWHVRWWARKVGKPNVVSPNNSDYGIGTRTRVTAARGAAFAASTLGNVAGGLVTALVVMQ